jgi:hypothetical protein
MLSCADVKLDNSLRLPEPPPQSLPLVNINQTVVATAIPEAVVVSEKTGMLAFLERCATGVKTIFSSHDIAEDEKNVAVDTVADTVADITADIAADEKNDMEDEKEAILEDEKETILEDEKETILEEIDLSNIAQEVADMGSGRKLKCNKCARMLLRKTLEKNGGLCGHCIKVCEVCHEVKVQLFRSTRGRVCRVCHETMIKKCLGCIRKMLIVTLDANGGYCGHCLKKCDLCGVIHKKKRVILEDGVRKCTSCHKKGSDVRMGCTRCAAQYKKSTLDKRGGICFKCAAATGATNCNKVSKALATQVWNAYIGPNERVGKCYVCSSEIRIEMFQMAHVVSRILLICGPHAPYATNLAAMKIWMYFARSFLKNNTAHISLIGVIDVT